MRRVLFGSAVVTGVFSVTLAMAASLGGLTNPNLGADDGSVASCDTDGVTTTFTTSYDATDQRIEVATIAVAGINNNCDGKTLTVTATNSSGSSIGSGSVAIAVDALSTTQAVTMSTQPSAELTANLHVSIT